MEEVIYKGISSKTIGLEVIDWVRPFLPASRDLLDYVEGVDGSKHTSKPLGDSFLQVTFRAFFNNDTEKTALREQVAQWLYTEEFQKLEVSDEPNIYYMAKVLDDSELHPSLFTAEFTITFTCHPLRYGAVRQEVLSGSGGVVTNNGTYRSKAKITIVTNADIEDAFELIVNGVSISCSGMIPSGATVTVDGIEYELRVDGNLKVLEVDGYFPELKSGDNNISVTPSSSIQSITIDWQELYI